MSAAFACAAVRCEVGMPTKRRPCRRRRASASTAKAAVGAAAKSNDHVTLDQLHRSLGGGALEGVAVGIGRGSNRVHAITAAAAALARMSAIALA